MSKNTIIIGDCHGNLDALITTLMAAGAVSRDGTKNKDWRVVSVGDLCNMAPYGQSYRGFVSEDLETLEYGMTVIDDLVIGNHELHFLSGAFDRSVGIWHGMATGSELQDGIMGAFMRAADKGLYVAAVEVDGMLVTHAGLHKYFFERGEYSADAAETALRLNQEFEDRVFGESNYVEALDHMDGIFWLRPTPHGGWNYGHGTPFPQVCGHTPLGSHPMFYDHLNAWIIDSGGYMDKENPHLGAIVKREGDDGFSVLKVSA